MRDTALSTHDENGIITLILNSNDSEGSSDSVGLELEAAPLKSSGESRASAASAESEASAASAASEANSPRPPKRCFEFFRRFSYKRLWGDSQR